LRDGTIEYRGRNDSQVKLRGFRIELGEIESRWPAAGVREAAVICARTRRASAPRRLLATDAFDRTPASADGAVDALPSTCCRRLRARGGAAADGQRQARSRALPRPTRRRDRARYEAPSARRGDAGADIWQRLLDVARVGRHDQFFELGGHSLMAVQVRRGCAARWRGRGARELFAQPTLAGFSAQVERAAAGTPALVARRRLRRRPLSLSQQRLWFLSQLDAAAGVAYHVATGCGCRAARRAALRRALDALVARHEACGRRSSRRPTAKGRPQAVQCIGPIDTPFSLAEHDLRAWRTPRVRRRSTNSPPARPAPRSTSPPAR
jgi:hypothetical protein